MYAPKNLVISGVISARPCQSTKEYSSEDRMIVLMGPTGTGKSAFIEALASKSPDGRLGISKNQLESVTKVATVYQLENVKDKLGCYINIVDTPGMADPDISELQVLKGVERWRDECNNYNNTRALYFHSITDPRMPGTKKRCLEIMQAFWGNYNAEPTSLVTSMWNTLTEKARKKAEMRREDMGDLEKDFWGDWKDKGSRILKFDNTYDSALEVLDAICVGANRLEDEPRITGLKMKNTKTDKFILEEELRERFSQLKQELNTITDNLNDPEAKTNAEWRNAVLQEQSTATRRLRAVVQDLADFLGVSPSELLGDSTPQPSLETGVSSSAKQKGITGRLKGWIKPRWPHRSALEKNKI
ncbi:hypothetical protein CVT24_001381 [Panaeolus cyanescens]|uniref:G domain-containing protein n=1 Tax=Panaeolus cyanescens TaxID=181874 RepID=A0A409VTH9_9AGAR|nr:hypothetical protein CVT24_001381 [Panaeolus cyanescens]